MKNLSTSSSKAEFARSADAKAVDQKAYWLTTLIAAAVIAIILLFAYEWTLRAAGAEPNFRENQARWSLVRDAAGKDSSLNAIALLGASRIRSSVSLSELEDRYPEHNIYPLGYPARIPCAVLHDLAQTTEFRGTIVISMNANWVDCRPSQHQMHDIINRYHREWNWARSLDARATNLVTQFLTCTDPRYSLRGILENAMEHQTLLPPKSHEVRRKNRQIEFDFAQRNDAEVADIAKINLRWFRWRAREGSESLPDVWLSSLDALAGSIETITDRGGQVVIVRFPTSGPLRLEESEHFPRHQYWDDLAARLPASAILHFEDYPAIAKFNLPDDSHLDYRDAAPFTQALFDIIEREGVDLER